MKKNVWWRCDACGYMAETVSEYLNHIKTRQHKKPLTTRQAEQLLTGQFVD